MSPKYDPKSDFMSALPTFSNCSRQAVYCGVKTGRHARSRSARSKIYGKSIKLVVVMTIFDTESSFKTRFSRARKVSHLSDFFHIVICSPGSIRLTWSLMCKMTENPKVFMNKHWNMTIIDIWITISYKSGAKIQ